MNLVKKNIIARCNGQFYTLFQSYGMRLKYSSWKPIVKRRKGRKKSSEDLQRSFVSLFFSYCWIDYLCKKSKADKRKMKSKTSQLIVINTNNLEGKEKKSKDS